MTKWSRWAALCAVVLGCVFLTACGPGKADLKMTLNPGDSRTLTIASTTETSMEFGGQSVNPKESTTMRYKLGVDSVDANGVATVTVTVLEQGGEGGGQVEEGPMAGMMGSVGEIMSALEGETFTMKLTPKGQVSDVEGMDPLIDKALDATMKQVEGKLPENLQIPGMSSTDLRVYLKGAFRSELGPEATALMFERILGAYPEQPVDVGDNWTRTITDDYGSMPAIIQETITVKERQDNLLTVAIDRTYNPNPNAKGLSFGPVSITREATGTVAGTATFDVSSGWIVQEEFSGSLDLSMGLAGMKIPSKMTMSTKVDIE
jgi:hypothetical protein